MSRPTVAYTAPFAIFVLLLGLTELPPRWVPGGLPADALVYPFQTVVCAGVIAWFWRDYDFGRWRRAWLAAAVGLLAFALWTAPQWLLHRPARLGGFDPGRFAASPALFRVELVFRFLRLLVVVPILEELFWRGFALRYFIREDFLRVPFGTYARRAHLAVAVGFMLEHQRPDWPAALATGLLYNLVAFQTRSLRGCILAHALTNGLLGVYIMHTRQWGYW